MGAMDPLWGVLSLAEGRFGAWDREKFFETGEREIAALMQAIEPLNRPARRSLALDFGCGVGRLTRALRTRFERAYGVDISAPMIEQAKELNADIPGCEFITNEQERLPFPNRHFDLIYTRIVLQHLGSRRLIKAYIGELFRTVGNDGLLVFQVLTHIPPWRRLQIRHWAYQALRAVGFGSDLLYRRLRLMPFGAIHISEPEVRSFLAGLGARVLRVDHRDTGRSGVRSGTFFVAR
jgi:SAM-dependent methyltransferase